MRNALIIPLGEEELVITSDNSGGIGQKEQDLVKVSYDVVGYHSFRVAVMECLAAGAKPITVVLQNFCGNEAWNSLIEGVQKGLKELDIDIPITGSTETNFSLSQSAVGINIVGKKPVQESRPLGDWKNMQIALIGLPLVGEEVLTQRDQVAPLALFNKICEMGQVVVWPVGSKGVLHELERMVPGRGKRINPVEIDIYKSGGPSTSFLVAYPEEQEQTIKAISGNYFHKL